MSVRRSVRRLVRWLMGAALVGAIVIRRHDIIDAGDVFGRLSVGVLVVLGSLAVLDRLIRADVFRLLLPGVSLRRSVVIGDVGAAASKGVPGGGPVGTILRWQIAGEDGISFVTFLVMVVASGVATAFVSWGYVLGATVVDLHGRSPSAADIAILSVSAGVLIGSTAFWTFILGSSVALGRATRLVDRVWVRMVVRFPAAAGREPAAVVDEVRRDLRRIARRPLGLLMRTAVAHGMGALILWVALHGVGVGPELAGSEFARVYFVTLMLGSFAPTPGGVGVIEAGTTAALVAAGAEPSVALSAVLVYRFLTYVVPIVVGAGLYVAWQRRRASSRGDAARRPVEFATAPPG